jgi:hypothetical protein
MPVTEFRVPNFLGKGGLPINVEWIARQLEDEYGGRIDAFEWILAVHSMVDLLDEVEDYWERGNGARKSGDVLFHNLAVWGFEAGDAYNITAKDCEDAIQNPRDDWFSWPSEPRLRTAYKVFNPAQLPERRPETQITLAKRIGDQEGGIENLLVWLGANNCLGTVTGLKIVETGDNPPGPNSGCTLWTPTAFRKEFEILAEQIAQVNAANVYVATIPHVTIPPITRGIMADRGRLPKSRRYFDYYTRFFIKDKDFDPQRDPFLSRADVEKIDAYVDHYNVTIRAMAGQHGWHIVDMCQVLDNLAVRRNHGNPPYVLPAALRDLNVRFFETTTGGKVLQGGLISLDGIHPTTCGYAIAAQEYINVMRVQNPGIKDIDFARMRSLDTLVASPPRTLDDMFGFLETLERWFHVSALL